MDKPLDDVNKKELSIDWKSLTESSPDYIMLLDRNFTILFFNRKIPGFAHKQIINRPILDLIHRDQHSQILESFQSVIDSGVVVQNEISFTSSNRQSDLFEIRISAISNDLGKIRQFVCSLNNISQSKKINENLNLKKLLHDKGERVKELQCLYGVAESIRNRSTKEGIFQDIADLIPPGWHYPAITRGKVVFEGKEYVSEPFTETKWQQSCDIVVHGKVKGSIQVYYLEPCPELDEGPFMREERDLINGISRNISEAIELMLAEEELRKLSRAVEASSSAVMITDLQGCIEYVNPKFTELTGYSKEEVLGQNPRILQSGETSKETYVELWKIISSGEDWKGEIYNRRKDGSLYWARDSISPIKDANGNITHYIGLQDDVTHEYQLTEQLTYQASHDSLTGLINRYEFERRSRRLLSEFDIQKDEHALCFMDLDQFKVINDSCGHTAGDELLRQVGRLLLGAVRRRDTLARLGGDEFGVLMEQCTLKQAHRVADTILSKIQDFQFTWEGQSFRVGISIGLVAITETTQNLTELLKQADAACYMAKDLGRNRIHVYHQADIELAQRHGEMQWVARINRALEANRFCFYFQAIVPLDKNSSDKHYELLLRMVDDDGKIISPGSFLPAAERYSLIEKLDAWVVKNALNLLAQYPAFVEQTNFISINLSGQSLTNSSFLNFIITELDKSKIKASKICFEITETVAITNLNSATFFISTLKQLGCHFALDDFGSGLSSFGYLKNLPVDFLKIDGMFVKNMVTDPISYAMVKSINEIGHVMGMQTIAEFVENDEIKQKLRQLGVNYAQGYIHGKPQPLVNLLKASIT